MKKEAMKNGALQVIAKVAELEGNMLYSGWPPPCAGFIYQPKRPEKKNTKSEK